jgi:hypothetical protein
MTMTQPSPTLRELTGMPAAPAPLSGSALIMIDLQNTYTEGVMALEGVEPAIDRAATLLERARRAGIPIIHIQHDAGEGSPYDVHGVSGAIVDRVAPKGDEQVVVKNVPSAFVGTDLGDRLRAAGTRDLVLAGFMTHMCVQFRLPSDGGRRGDRHPRPARPGRHRDGRQPAGGEPRRALGHVRRRGAGGRRHPRLIHPFPPAGRIAPRTNWTPQRKGWRGTLDARPAAP